MAEAKSTTESPAEEWRPIPGWEGFYSVSSLGNVRRDKTTTCTRAGSIRVPYLTKSGYYRVTLHRPGGSTKAFVHQLVGWAFIGPKPSDRPFINHKDGQPLNNRPDNLEYVTNEENMAHAVATGLILRGDASPSRLHPERMARGERVKGSVLKPDKVLCIRNEYTPKRGEFTRLAKKYGVTRRSITRIIEGDTWTHV